MWLAERAAGVGSGWGTGVLKADSQAGCRSVHFFSHTCMNGHRQIRPSVPLHCLDESQVWLGFWRFPAWLCEAEGQRCSFYCRSAPGYLWGMWGSPVSVQVLESTFSTMGQRLCSCPSCGRADRALFSWSSGCHTVLLYWWAESCWKYFSRAQKRNGSLCCFTSFKTVAFHF